MARSCVDARPLVVGAGRHVIRGWPGALCHGFVVHGWRLVTAGGIERSEALQFAIRAITDGSAGLTTSLMLAPSEAKLAELERRADVVQVLRQVLADELRVESDDERV